MSSFASGVVPLPRAPDASDEARRSRPRRRQGHRTSKRLRPVAPAVSSVAVRDAQQQRVIAPPTSTVRRRCPFVEVPQFRTPPWLPGRDERSPSGATAQAVIASGPADESVMTAPVAGMQTVSVPSTPPTSSHPPSGATASAIEGQRQVDLGDQPAGDLVEPDGSRTDHGEPPAVGIDPYAGAERRPAPRPPRSIGSRGASRPIPARRRGSGDQQPGGRGRRYCAPGRCARPARRRPGRCGDLAAAPARRARRPPARGRPRRRGTRHPHRRRSRCGSR